MAFEATITEQNMDEASRQFVQGFRTSAGQSELDLDVDGLSESILSRLLGIFRSGKSR